MTIDKLYDLYKNNIYSILDSHMMATISERTYDIHGFNLVNRLLIYIQNKYTTSVKSEAGWDIVGRSVKDKSSPIWVIDNIIKTQYIDCETNELINENEINPNEIAQALSLGIIEKQKYIEGLKCVPLFNIKDTTIFDNKLYRVYSFNERNLVKISLLLNLITNDFGIICYQSEGKSMFDKKSNILYIGKDQYNSKTKSIGEAIFSKTDCESAIAEYKDDLTNKEISTIIKICETFMCESLLSYCDKDYTVEADSFKLIEEMDFKKQSLLDAFLALLAVTYDFVEEIICLINPENHRISESTLRKAAELLSILEANDAVTRLKG